MRFLHLIRPVMCVLPEVASPDRKVRNSEAMDLDTVITWHCVEFIGLLALLDQLEPLTLNRRDVTHPSLSFALSIP
jgi:hypothetical protein